MSYMYLLLTFSKCLVAASVVLSSLQVLFNYQTAALPSSSNSIETTRANIALSYTKLPLNFELNQGQFDSRVKYLSRGKGYNLFLTPSEAVIALDSTEEVNKQSVLKMKLVDANVDPEVVGLDELAGKVSYLNGNDKTKWQANVPTYSKVKYVNAYKGIDLVYYGNQQQLEYDFVVSPGEDPKNIKFAYTGTDKIETHTDGNLVFHVGNEEVELQKPIAYQETNGVKREVATKYLLAENNTISFEVGEYDNNKTLVIDPVLNYSTYFGGSSSEVANGIALDNDNNVYITGRVTPTVDFPVQSPFQSSYGGGSTDVFVTKLSANGNSLIYSTYLGGNGQDTAFAIALDSEDHAYVTGFTQSANFPTSNPFQSNLANSGGDAFVTKLSSDGSALEYSTFIGGGGNNSIGVDFSQRIKVDSAGHAYITGFTTSTDFPIQDAYQSSNASTGRDVFVTKFSADGSSLVYSTYLGGTGDDTAFGLAIDTSDNVYITGSTHSTNFPLANAYQTDPGGVFITKLNASGSGLDYSTYLGSSGGATGYGIAVKNDGSVYVTGSNGGADFPTVNALYPTRDSGYGSFLAKLASDGGSLDFSTYLGGNEGIDLALDGTSNVYITGTTNSTNFPTYHPVQSSLNGAGDAFVTKIANDGQSVQYSTYLGGSDVEFGVAITVDSTGNNAYITGVTDSSDFPVVNPFQSTYHGQDDAFIAKVFDDGSNLPPTVDSGGPYTVQEGGSVILTATGNDPENGSLSYAWDLDNNSTFETPGDTVTFSAATLNGPSSHIVTVQVTDDANQSATSQTTVSVTNANPTIGAVGISPNPARVNVQLSATAAFTDTGISDTHTATWNWGDGNTTVGTVTESNGSGTVSNTHTYTSTGTYTLTLTVTDNDGGVKTRTRTILVR